MLSITPANGLSWTNDPPRDRLPPVTDENTIGSSSTRSASAWRLTTQNPSPPGVSEMGSCQSTGAACRSQVNTCYGKPFSNRSRSVRSKSTEAA